MDLDIQVVDLVASMSDKHTVVLDSTVGLWVTALVLDLEATVSALGPIALTVEGPTEGLAAALLAKLASPSIAVLDAEPN